jgi:hypothetical protein
MAKTSPSNKEYRIHWDGCDARCYGAMAIVSLRKNAQAAAAYPTRHQGIGSTKFRHRIGRAKSTHYKHFKGTYNVSKIIATLIKFALDTHVSICFSIC